MKELDITTLASTGTSAITWQMAANMIEYAHKISVHRRARKERREGKLVLVSFKFRFISAVSVLSVVNRYLARATVGQPASVWVQVSSKEVNMNWLDIVIIVVLGILTVLGMKRGLIKSLVPLVGVVLGIVLAGRLHHALAERLGFIESESLAGIIAFVLILIAVYVLVSILGSMLRGMLRMVFLGWVDRLGGGVFGFAVGWIICSVIVVLLARYVALPAEIPEMPIPELGGWIEDWRGLEGIRLSVTTAISESKLATVQIDSFPVILGLLPERFAVVRDFFGK